jgi:RNA polymerase sigma factor (TIGR02999 family)
MDTPADVTQILKAASDGNREALDRLLPLVYDELRRLAQHHLADERADHTLQATALVHEAYMRLIDQKRVVWQNRAHFFAVASQAIRRILVDHARAREAARRGGGAERLPIDAALDAAIAMPGTQILALNAALTRLADDEPDKARIVEMRFFGGLTNEEIAEVIGASLSTIERQWRFARAWLYRELDGAGAP